jgi:putative transposase
VEKMNDKLKQGGQAHENEALQHRTDHRHPEGSRSQTAGQGLCRKNGISDATIYNWKKKYGGMSVSEAQRLKSLVADQALDIQMRKEITTKKW